MSTFITPPNSGRSSNTFHMAPGTKEKLQEAIQVLESYFTCNQKIDSGERKKMAEDLAFLFNEDNDVSFAVSKMIGCLLAKRG